MILFRTFRSMQHSDNLAMCCTSNIIFSNICCLDLRLGKLADVVLTRRYKLLSFFTILSSVIRDMLVRCGRLLPDSRLIGPIFFIRVLSPINFIFSNETSYTCV